MSDFAGDPFAREMTFGFDVDGRRWHMVVSGNEDGELDAVLEPGFPDQPILYWEMTAETLERFDAGMNGETATTRARAEDPVLLKTRATPGFPRYAVNAELNSFLEQMRLHFWTRGRPQVFPLGSDYAVTSHGGNAVGLVYSEGMRTLWYQVMPGQHVNEAVEEQTNPFDSLIIVMSGKIRARLGGREMLLEPGNAYLVPEGMTHEFWNDFEQPFEYILVMYGEQA